MITQKLLAHLPLLLHPRPAERRHHRARQRRHAGAALTHPVAAVDVVEISPEVVEASRYFDAENRSALRRSAHAAHRGRWAIAPAPVARASTTSSSPSRPIPGWPASPHSSRASSSPILRSRLAPGGIICQWAHTYDISAGGSPLDRGDVRVRFPGCHDVAGRERRFAAGRLAGAARDRLDGIARAWRRPGVRRRSGRRCLSAARFALVAVCWRAARTAGVCGGGGRVSRTIGWRSSSPDRGR